MQEDDEACDTVPDRLYDNITEDIMRAKKQSPAMFVSHWEMDENDVDEWTEEDIANDPNKQVITAGERGQVSLLEDLLNAHPEGVLARDDDGYTALHRAAYEGHVDACEILLSRGADIEASSSDGWRPLHSAAFWNQAAVVDFLLRAGADPQAATNSGQTPLHLASSQNVEPTVLQLLLCHPLCPYAARNSQGETARDLAERHTPHARLFSHVLPSTCTL